MNNECNKNLTMKKKWVLKSGYPFENEIHQVLQNVFTSDSINREFEFSCHNEDGIQIIRSVDFVCSIKKDIEAIPHPQWGLTGADVLEITFIIDAKYSADEVYSFYRSYDSDQSFRWPSLIPAARSMSSGLIFRNDLLEFANIKSLKIATNGRKITENKGSRDSLTDAMLQITQGMSNIIKSRGSKIGLPMPKSGKYYRNANIFIPIIVTNSPILFVKDNLTIQSVNDAKMESEILDDYDLIALKIQPYYRLIQYVDCAKSVLHNSKNNLQWHGEGILEYPIVFCNSIGLQQFLEQIKIDFAILPLSQLH